MATKPQGNGSKVEFEDVSDDFAAAWKPKDKGEMREGIYCGAIEVDGERGDTFKSYRIKDAEGIMHGVSGSTLEARMAKIPRGATIRVTYMGTQESKRGSDMKLFNVQVAKGTKVLEAHEVPVEANA